MAVPCWQRQSDAIDLADAFDKHSAAMHPCDGRDDGQSQPVTRLPSRAGGVCTIEAVEHLGSDRRRYFEPRVEDTQSDESMIRLDENPNRVAGAGVADGIGEEVHEGTQHEGRVADRRGVARPFRDHISFLQQCVAVADSLVRLGPERDLFQSLRLYGHLQMAAGEGVNGNKYVGGRLGYEAGPINIGFAYGKTETGATTPDFKNYNIQFNYKLGFATLHTLYDVKEWNPRKTKDLSIGATVPVGPGALKVGYTRADRSGGPAGSGFSDADDSTRLGVGYVYDLSKRTAMYTTYGQVTNKGAARSSVLYTPPAAMLGGEKSSGLEFGIRHTF